MAGSLVFVLTLLGLALLMIAERVGLAAPLGLAGMLMVLSLAVIVTGLGSVTSRFPRFAGVAGDTGARKAHALRLMSRATCVLVALAAFLPAGVELRALVPGFAAGFVLAHLGACALAAPVLAARLGRFLLGFAFALLALGLLQGMLMLLPPGLWNAPAFRLSLGGLVLLVLLPGGALGVVRVQRLLLLLALVAALVPLAVMVSLATLERGDPMALEMLEAVQPLLQKAFSEVMTSSYSILSGLVVGAVGGFAARSTSPASGASAAFGLVAALLLAGVLVLLHLAAAEWLARLVGQRIVGLAPGAWPPFVFEPELKGWMRTCGILPVDPLAVARACGAAGPQQVLRPSDITFLAQLSLPALAVANRLPVILGDLWALLPVLVGGAGLLSLLQGAALAFSESVLFGLFNPSGLHSFRLAMARLCLLALVVALFMLAPLSHLSARILTSALTILLGFMALLVALSQLRRASVAEPEV